MARKILLADDSVTAQNMGRKILADAGYEVITVNNGSAALKKFAEQKPDLIVLDVYMPGYSGLEVCQRLKENPETSRVPVLLTVGKLEPFKPEEAKRVRADGYIVKPFEASELLSALSKLEDKIVPRQETSKPGRFARVTAAIEEGRYDKTVAIEEDLGWKDRISFPRKKTEKALQVQKDGADVPATLESPNKGLGYAIEHKLAERPQASAAEEAKVDLGALAPEGLPKDVTPDEIAALASAAAQVKGKIADSRTSAEAVGRPTDMGQPAAATTQELTAPAPITTSTTEKFEEQLAEKIEGKVEVPRVHDSAETSGDVKLSEAAIAAAGLPAVNGGDATAALTGAPDAGSTNRLAFRQPDDHGADDLVTMAVAMGEASSQGLSRWTAVPVTLGAEEAAISLEHEMQKAYAAFAAAEVGHAALTLAASPVAPEDRLGPIEPATTASSIPPLSEPVPSVPEMSIPAVPAPEAVQTLSALAHASTDALRAAVQELEMVAESHVADAAPAGSSEPASLVAAAPEAHVVPEPSQTVEAFAPGQAEAARLETPRHDEWASSHEEPKKEELKEAGPKKEEPTEQDDRSEVAPFAAIFAVPPTDGQSANAGRAEATAAITSNEVFPQPATPASVSSEPVSSELTAGANAAVLASAGTAKNESDPSATTAAAWASWRRIRESSDPKTVAEKSPDSDSASAIQDVAARAVAAGAESTPEGSSETESDPTAIASIVDSVLADLRPRIYEEISRKMAKKK